jgi:putative transposase
MIFILKIFISITEYIAIDLSITKIVTAINNDGKFFEVKAPRPDNYWNPTIDTAKSRRDHD